MGQTHSAPPQDALQFREMVRLACLTQLKVLVEALTTSTGCSQVLAAYHGDVAMLRHVFRWELRALQVRDAVQYRMHQGGRSLTATASTDLESDVLGHLHTRVRHDRRRDRLARA